MAERGGGEHAASGPAASAPATPSAVSRTLHADRPKPWVALPQKHAQFLSGMAAGAISSFALHPLHLIQTRLQVQDGKSRYSGATSAFKTILRQEGVRGLYQGTIPAMFGSAVAWGGYMFLYQHLKQEWAKRRDGGVSGDGANTRVALGPGAHLTCGMLAGSLTALLTNPIWVIKTRFELQSYKQKGNYTSLLDAVRTIRREEGFRGFYSGLVPALAGVSHGAVMFVAYEEIKHLMTMRSGNPELDWVEGFVAGAAAKVFATVATYPYQVCKARLQQRPAAGEGRKYSGVVDVIRKTYRMEGLRGFYKGALICTIRVTPGSAITFGVYEFLKPRLSSEDFGV